MHNNDELPSTDALLSSLEEQLSTLYSQSELENLRWVGVLTGGVWVAKKLIERLNISVPLGELDISFYRDDFSQSGLNPKVVPSTLPFELDQSSIMLIDDVMMTGRTIRAAMNELFDYGRPQSIQLLSLVDVSGRQLPIHPDYVGAKLSLLSHQRIKLTADGSLEIKELDNALP